MTNANGFRIDRETARAPRAQLPHEIGANLSGGDMLARAKAGDRSALEALLSAIRPRLYVVALKMVRSSDDAEDVVQEAMMKVWKYVGRFEGRAALSTWLHRIVANTAIDHLRARRHGVNPGHRSGEGDRGEHPAAFEAIECDTPEDLLGRAEVGAVVRGAMAGLSAAHREVLSLRELDGESYQAIAETARCPVGTVMSRLHHARHRLAETLGSEHSDLRMMRAA